MLVSITPSSACRSGAELAASSFTAGLCCNSMRRTNAKTARNAIFQGSRKWIATAVNPAANHNAFPAYEFPQADTRTDTGGRCFSLVRHGGDGWLNGGKASTQQKQGS